MILTSAAALVVLAIVIVVSVLRMVRANEAIESANHELSRERDEAEQAATEARSYELASHARAALERDPELCLLLAAHALEAHPSPSTLGTLFDALNEVRSLREIELSAPLTALSAAPDGRWVVVDQDGRAHLFSSVGELERTLDAEGVRMARFGPLGTRMLLAHDVMRQGMEPREA